MLRIRKVQDDTTPANIAVIKEAQTIMRRQFAGLAAADVDKLQSKIGRVVVERDFLAPFRA